MLLRNKLGVLLLFFSVLGFTQDLDDIERSEFTVGLNSNTNGSLISGLNFRYTYLTELKKYNLFEFELVNVKHEREERFSSANSSSFIPGKISYLIALRPSYGKEITLFQKYPEDGIRLNFTYSAGPTIGIVKPYFIKYYRSPSNQNSLEAYDPTVHSIGLITGDAGIISGFKGSKVNLGAHVRSSLNFEYGPYEDVKVGIETGVTLEAYTKSNILLINNEKRFFYSAFFLHLYYGFTF